MARTRFGLHLTDFSHPAWAGAELLPRLTALCRVLEESDVFDTLWLPDHLHHLGPGGPGANRPESMMQLAAAAVPTSTLRLGLLVASATFRHPALLVKMVTTLDVLSGGRAVLGIGAGHPRTEVEHRAYDIPFPPLGERIDRLDDALRVIRAMLRGEGSPNAPAPVGPLPVMVGGSGERRMLRLVARYADMCNVTGDVSTLARKIDVLHRHCAEVGRDPAEVGVTWMTPLILTTSSQNTAEVRQMLAAASSAQEIAGFTVGQPHEIPGLVAGHIEAGADEVIFSFPFADTAGITAVGEAFGLSGH